VTAIEPSLSEGGSEAPEPSRRAASAVGAWLPTWDLITTKNLEIRKHRGLIVTVAVLIVVPTVLALGLRLLFTRSTRTAMAWPATRPFSPS